MRQYYCPKRFLRTPGPVAEAVAAAYRKSSRPGSRPFWPTPIHHSTQAQPRQAWSRAEGNFLLPINLLLLQGVGRTAYDLTISGELVGAKGESAIPSIARVTVPNVLISSELNPGDLGFYQRYWSPLPSYIALNQ